MSKYFIILSKDNQETKVLDIILGGRARAYKDANDLREAGECQHFSVEGGFDSIKDMVQFAVDMLGLPEPEIEKKKEDKSPQTKNVQGKVKVRGSITELNNY